MSTAIGWGVICNALYQDETDDLCAKTAKKIEENCLERQLKRELVTFNKKISGNNMDMFNDIAIIAETYEEFRIFYHHGKFHLFSEFFTKNLMFFSNLPRERYSKLFQSAIISPNVYMFSSHGERLYDAWMLLSNEDIIDSCSQLPNRFGNFEQFLTVLDSKRVPGMDDPLDKKYD